MRLLETVMKKRIKVRPEIPILFRKNQGTSNIAQVAVSRSRDQPFR